MSLPATDNFNRANGGEGANWTNQRNSFTIASNQTSGTASGASNDTLWNADVFADDQYAQLKVINVQDGGPTVRASGTAASTNYYAYGAKTGATSTVTKIINASYTALQSGLPTPGANSILKITVEGTTIKLFDDGAQAGIDQTDSSLSSGSAGKYGYDVGFICDDWEGGVIAAVPNPPVGSVYSAREFPKMLVRR